MISSVPVDLSVAPFLNTSPPVPIVPILFAAADIERTPAFNVVVPL